jgi:hypothetical protein
MSRRRARILQMLSGAMALALLCTAQGSRCPAFASCAQSELEISADVHAQMVRLVCEEWFKDNPPGTEVFLFADNIRSSWLPTGLRTHFNLLTADEVRAREAEGGKYYFFTEPEDTPDGFEIALQYGQRCKAFGPAYLFHIVDGKLTLVTPPSIRESIC